MVNKMIGLFIYGLIVYYLTIILLENKIEIFYQQYHGIERLINYE